MPRSGKLRGAKRRSVNPLIALLIALALALATPAAAAPSPDPAKASVAKSARAKNKNRVRHIPRGVGFLPGYRTPAQIERERYKEWQRERRAYERSGVPPVYYYDWGYPQAGFYRGRWNGGSFGPCWTVTPIGYQRNCGR